MPKTELFIQVLTAPKNLLLGENAQEASSLKACLPQLKSQTIEGAEHWFLNNAPSTANTRIKVLPTGHMTFYNSMGRRMLSTDPAGFPLHECEWATSAISSSPKLTRARMQLDSREWVGIVPRAKTFSTELDLTSQPNWQKLTLDDMRKQAAESWDVSISEVEYFYKDENFTRLGDGKYRINASKDCLYALRDGKFDEKLFISFMYAVSWERLDLIPVVELFQSTLPGTGAAAFELIWGLYDDQSQEAPLEPLRYRGLPPYPSREAFNIFSAFFTPQGPAGDDLFQVFMDTMRCHEITWTPRQDPPWRYFSDKHKICLTVQDGFLYKITVWDDPVAIPYVNGSRGARPSCQRRLHVKNDVVQLVDDKSAREIPLNPQWGVKPDAQGAQPPVEHPFSWKHFFRSGPPQVDSVKMLYTQAFYPEGAAEIDEASLQPMALDQAFYYMEMSPDMPEKLEKAKRVLVHTFDTVISGCIDSTHARDYVVLYSDAEFAQKNAQLLWNYAAGEGQLENLRNTTFLPEAEHVEAVYKEKFDVIFKWIPFFYYAEQETCAQILDSAVRALNPGGLLFLVGPAPIAGLFDHFKLNPLHDDPIDGMPFFLQHKKMCPENLVHPHITVFLAEKKSD